MLQILDPTGKISTGVALPELNPDEMIFLYRAMLRIRVIDEKMMTLQRQGRVGFYGACTGQEASVVGSAYALRNDDWVFPALREGGVALLRGVPLREYVGQVLGNCADPLRGRQMPCHFSSRAVNHVSWSSCIATQLPQAVGTALAMKLKGVDSVCIAYLGDGATSEPDFHAAMNFAGVFNTPVVFFCQNNQWAISVPLEIQTASESIAAKAVAYGFEGIRVDGNDVFGVYHCTLDAVSRARRGIGPTLIEAVTYRVGAHSSSDDPSRYRDETVTEQWKSKDPILRMELFFAERKLLTSQKAAAFREEFTQEISKVLDELEKLPYPPAESLFQDVYSQPLWHLEEQRAQYLGE